MTILISLMVAQTSLAECEVEVQDCKDRCQVVIRAADKVIKDLKDEVNVRKQLEAKQTEEIANVIVMINEKDQQLQSPLRNPVLMVLLGITVGVVGISLLRK